MRVISRKPLEEIRAEEQQLKAKNTQLSMLGFALTEEKLNNAKKQTMLDQLGNEVIQLKIKVKQLEGVAGK